MENKVNILGVNVDKVTTEEAVDRIFVMLEERKCDVCQQIYKVEMHYTLKYEERL